MGAGSYHRTFLELASMVATWWIVAFCAVFVSSWDEKLVSVYVSFYIPTQTDARRICNEILYKDGFSYVTTLFHSSL